MPNKYEREIEEILRNMERTEPKPGLGQKLGGRIRRKSDSRSNVRRRADLSLHFASRSGVLRLRYALLSLLAVVPLRMGEQIFLPV